MHPYVKHHLHRSIALVVLILMILNQPVNSSRCHNYPVKKIKIFSEFTKGHVRIERGKVMAAPCKPDCMNSTVIERNYLYKVTIYKHYMLLYHIKSGKFICWDKSFKRLIPKTHPLNLKYCTFEDKMSNIKAYSGSRIRFTSKNHKGKEVEMHFNKSGAFAKPRFIKRCYEKHKRTKHNSTGDASEGFGRREMIIYKYCASPDFLQSEVEKCVSGLSDFCMQMKIQQNSMRRLTPEIARFCNFD